jgi:hypothetical protein
MSLDHVQVRLSMHLNTHFRVAIEKGKGIQRVLASLATITRKLVDKKMNVLDRVSVKVQSSTDHDEDDTYKAFTDVRANIFLDDNVEIGNIHAILVNRQAIPEYCFFETFDDHHSSDMEWIGTSLLENCYGRTKLQSLREYDDPEFDFMFISSFRVHADYNKDGNSDVAAAALYKFLHDPTTIKGNLDYGCWRVSSAAYLLNPQEPTPNNSKQHRKRKRAVDETPQHELARMDADPFLRNGFFQDPSLVRQDSANTRILVASYGNWSNAILSQAQVSSVNLLSESPKPSGKDAEILQLVQSVFDSSDPFGASNVHLAAVMIGQEQYEPPGDTITTLQLASLRSNLFLLVQAGGSISRSTALHLACEKNSKSLVKLLLEMDPAAVNYRDTISVTPLMVAAKNASGRCSINGIDDTLVIDSLFESGADKTMTDSVGMTAYGYFRKTSKMMFDITHYHSRGKLVALESKLCPLTGPTVVDLADGNGANTGLVDYGPEDDEADREMGRGRYASDQHDY